MGIRVCKFGGSSVADAEQLRKVRAIIEARADRRFVVPSAPGKRFKDDEKVTDLLYRADVWVIIVYMAVMMVIGAMVSKTSRDVEGYAVGNRNMSGWVLGLSVLGTFTSRWRAPRAACSAARP